MMKYLALCLFCKDENAYLPEWLNYHLALGVDHVLIYDNNSAVPVAQAVGDYVRSGRVTVLSWAETTQGRQCRAYARCLADFGRDYRWIGFTDTDEFIVPKITTHLPTFLSAYEGYGGLALFWLCFGSNRHVRRPPGGVIRSFTRRSRPEFHANDHVKTIVNPAQALLVAPGDPHSFRYRDGFGAVDEHGVSVPGARRRPHTSDLIQLNHYVLRSRDEFDDKRRRGGGNSTWSRSEAFFQDYDSQCNAVEDIEILRIADLLCLGAGPV
jgi:hypothetical protein